MLRVCVIGLGHIGNLHSRIYMEDELVELVGHLCLPGGEQVRIAIGDVDALMPHAVCDGQRGESLVDQQRDMAMSKLVEAENKQKRRECQIRCRTKAVN